MRLIKGLFTFIKTIFLLLLTIVFAFYLLVKATEWGAYFLIVKPKGEEIAYDIASYAEVNERYFTEEMLNQYVMSKRKSGYLKDNEKVSISYNQYAYDKRFTLEVNFDASYFDDMILPEISRIKLEGINSNYPEESLFGKYDEWSKQ